MILTALQTIQNQVGRNWRLTGGRGMFAKLWAYCWMQFAGLGYFGRFATWLASWFAPPYVARRYLAHYNAQGYISPSATIYHPQLRLGNNVFVGDSVLIFRDREGGSVELAERVRLYDEVRIQTGEGGSIKIGADSCIQPRCQFSAYKAAIEIGCGVQIAPCCAFYPYAHGVAPGELIRKQPLQTKGGIIIDDDAWLGYGVIVLDGVRVGKGAVIGAGAVVTQDIPDGAIAVGVPARVVKLRSSLTAGSESDLAGSSSRNA